MGAAQPIEIVRLPDTDDTRGGSFVSTPRPSASNLSVQFRACVSRRFLQVPYAAITTIGSIVVAMWFLLPEARFTLLPCALPAQYLMECFP
jgi:predicted ABC-type sugar transport system permease subunit